MSSQNYFQNAYHWAPNVENYYHRQGQAMHQGPKINRQSQQQNEQGQNNSQERTMQSLKLIENNNQRGQPNQVMFIYEARPDWMFHN